MTPNVVGEATLPEDLRDALAALPLAQATWRNLTAIARRDFIAWINEAKQLETRQRRIERCCENLVKGKRRPCCYAVVPMDFYKAMGTNPEAKAHWSRLSAIEKRDLTDWISEAEDKTSRKARIIEACKKLADRKSSF